MHFLNEIQITCLQSRRNLISQVSLILQKRKSCSTVATLLMFQRSKNTWTVVLCTWLKPRDQAHKSGQTAYAVRRLETYLTVWYIPYQMMRILHDTASGLFAINDGSPGLCLSVSVDTVSTVIWVLPSTATTQPAN